MAKPPSRAGDLRRPRGQANLVRIIGGLHRGRRLRFPDLAGLRPTSDRVRETLFNWLQPLLPGAACLDLFAGSGALGLEAASRGAGEVLMLDLSPQVVEQIDANIRLLELAQARVAQGDALRWLRNPGRPFDVVFVDPPFADELAAACCRGLETNGWLAPAARIYLETDAQAAEIDLPGNWMPLRDKRAGQVRYRLFLRQAVTTNSGGY